MRISDWSSDVCSSDLFSFLGPIERCTMRARRRVCRQRRFGLRVDMFDVTAGKGRKVARLDQQRCRAASARRLDNQRAGRARRDAARLDAGPVRSEEHTSELQSLMRISYAVFCLTKQKTTK